MIKSVGKVYFIPSTDDRRGGWTEPERGREGGGSRAAGPPDPAGPPRTRAPAQGSRRVSQLRARGPRDCQKPERPSSQARVIRSPDRQGGATEASPLLVQRAAGARASRGRPLRSRGARADIWSPAAADPVATVRGAFGADRGRERTQSTQSPGTRPRAPRTSGDPRPAPGTSRAPPRPRGARRGHLVDPRAAGPVATSGEETRGKSNPETRDPPRAPRNLVDPRPPPGTKSGRTAGRPGRAAAPAGSTEPSTLRAAEAPGPAALGGNLVEPPKPRGPRDPGKSDTESPPNPEAEAEGSPQPSAGSKPQAQRPRRPGDKRPGHLPSTRGPRAGEASSGGNR
ncbi:basic salivary proline-rich protein 1-like [Equus asinus]|uniref:basic salivary proline-rich protein 1-like n=1 Tax=Equus asinus TaxID=9793 RepID=UPI0038F68782